MRRTAHINATWPEGFGTPMHLTGRARDLVTTSGGVPVVLELDELRLELDATQTVLSMFVSPHRDGAERLGGASGFRGFRAAVDAALPQERARATPLAFLLDDVPALSMIGGIAWAQHRATRDPAAPRPQTLVRSSSAEAARSRARAYARAATTTRAWSKAITFPHWLRRRRRSRTSADAWSWHEIDPAPAVCLRRRRRIDTWRAGDVIEVDAHFRDSVWGPDHDEIALHEYSLTATIDGRIARCCSSIDVVSRVLPFPECPAAAPHVATLVGTDVTTFRTRVHEVLAGAAVLHAPQRHAAWTLGRPHARGDGSIR